MELQLNKEDEEETSLAPKGQTCHWVNLSGKRTLFSTSLKFEGKPMEKAYLHNSKVNDRAR